MSLVFAKAIEDGDLTLVESLLANDSIDVNARLPRPNNPPPLVHAVRCAWSSGRVDIVKLLLSTGADVDGVDDNGQTASFAAALARSVTALAVLLSHRPNLEIADEAKRRPLQISLNRKSDGISLMLINAGASLDGVQSLSSFAARSTAAIEALLNRGVAMNQLRDVMDGTPLHCYCDSACCRCACRRRGENAHQCLRP
jgi:hypothetical protein